MDAPPAPSCFLVLMGVRPSDYVSPGQLMEERLCSSLAIAAGGGVGGGIGGGIGGGAGGGGRATRAALRPPVPLPAVYTRAAWPAASSIRCWWCTLFFEGRPFFVPLDAAPAEPAEGGGLRMTALGNFCSAPCAAAFVGARWPCRYAYSEYCRHHGLLAQLAREWGLPVAAQVPPAPPPTELVEFGGGRSPADFRAAVAGLLPPSAS